MHFSYHPGLNRLLDFDEYFEIVISALGQQEWKNPWKLVDAELEMKTFSDI